MYTNMHTKRDVWICCIGLYVYIHAKLKIHMQNMCSSLIREILEIMTFKSSTFMLVPTWKLRILLNSRLEALHPSLPWRPRHQPAATACKLESKAAGKHWEGILEHEYADAYVPIHTCYNNDYDKHKICGSNYNRNRNTKQYVHT